MKQFFLVLLFLILLSSGIIVLAIGYSRFTEDLIETICLIISGGIDLVLCYTLGFTIYRNIKDKVDDFTIDDD